MSGGCLTTTVKNAMKLLQDHEYHNALGFVTPLYGGSAVHNVLLTCHGFTHFCLFLQHIPVFDQ